MMPHGTTVNIAVMINSARLSPENIGISLIIVLVS
jgi:hypothetical protein